MNTTFGNVCQGDCCHLQSSLSSGLPINLVLSQFLKCKRNTNLLPTKNSASLLKFNIQPFSPIYFPPKQIFVSINFFYFSSFCPVLGHFSLLSELKSSYHTFLSGSVIWASLRQPNTDGSFMEVLGNGHLLYWFNPRALKSKEMLEWPGHDIPPARKAVCMQPDETGPRVQGKSNCAQQLKISMFCKCDDHVLLDMGSEPVRQILCVSVEIQKKTLKEKRIFFMFRQLFWENQYLWDIWTVVFTYSTLCSIPEHD